MKPHAHILVVDDEINIRGALVTMLEKKGHQVRGVGTAEEGLAQLEAIPAELVITDLRMPGTRGYGVSAASQRQMAGYGSCGDDRLWVHRYGSRGHALWSL